MQRLFAVVATAVFGCSLATAAPEAKQRTPAEVVLELGTKQAQMPVENTGMSGAVQGLGDVTPKTRAAGRPAETAKRALGPDSEFCETLKKR